MTFKHLTPLKIKKQLEKISKNFGFKYNSDWFEYIWISKRHARYLEYVGMCFDPIYTRFGKTIEKRMQNIEKFEKSKELKEILKRYGGQAITKKEVIIGIKNCKKIKKIKLRKEMLEIHRRIKHHLKHDNLALLTKTNNKKEEEHLFKFVLRHEWLHLLLLKNGVNFKKIDNKYWKYDEGLVTYFDYYSENNLSSLERIKRSIKYPSTKIYYIYAIKFRELLKNCKTPKERKNKIKSLIEELK